MKIKRHLNFVNASYLFTYISYKGKTYTITAQEPSIYNPVSKNKFGYGMFYKNLDGNTLLRKLNYISFSFWSDLFRIKIFLTIFDFPKAILNTGFTSTCWIFIIITYNVYSEQHTRVGQNIQPSTKYSTHELIDEVKVNNIIYLFCFVRKRREEIWALFWPLWTFNLMEWIFQF